MWQALRALEENAALHRRLEDHARSRKMDVIADGYSNRADDAERRASAIREVLLGGGPPDHDQKANQAEPL
jgi:hypothetical protein